MISFHKLIFLSVHLKISVSLNYVIFRNGTRTGLLPTYVFSNIGVCEIIQGIKRNYRIIRFKKLENDEIHIIYNQSKQKVSRPISNLRMLKMYKDQLYISSISILEHQLTNRQI